MDSVLLLPDFLRRTSIKCGSVTVIQFQSRICLIALFERPKVPVFGFFDFNNHRALISRVILQVNAPSQVWIRIDLHFVQTGLVSTNAPHFAAGIHLYIRRPSGGFVGTPCCLAMGAIRRFVVASCCLAMNEARRLEEKLICLRHLSTTLKMNAVVLDRRQCTRFIIRCRGGVDVEPVKLTFQLTSRRSILVSEK